jgi:hypothetical protein
MNNGNVLESTLAKSADVAVWPPISSWTPVPALALGTIGARSVESRVFRSLVIPATGRTITAAAIMILVFASFILGGQMLILGTANWALPGAIDRVLPHLNVEGNITDESKPDQKSADEPEVLIPAASAA